MNQSKQNRIKSTICIINNECIMNCMICGMNNMMNDKTSTQRRSDGGAREADPASAPSSGGGFGKR